MTAERQLRIAERLFQRASEIHPTSIQTAEAIRSFAAELRADAERDIALQELSNLTQELGDDDDEPAKGGA